LGPNASARRSFRLLEADLGRTAFAADIPLADDYSLSINATADHLRREHRPAQEGDDDRQDNCGI